MTTEETPNVLERPTEEESYLWALLQDPSGLDHAEFLWYEPDEDDFCFRAWPFQWGWWRDQSPLQIDQCARSVGKTLSIQARCFAFPFLFPGQEAVVTAPELVHLEPLTQLIEQRFETCRLGREVRPRGRSAVTHRPFMMLFANGSRIIGRIPQRDGKGVKGIHPIRLELDEAQDYPTRGWTELNETLKRGVEGCQWRAHGVTRGLRDKFFEYTNDMDPDNHWRVHRLCLPSDTLVYGLNGPVRIEDIEIGTEVYSTTTGPTLDSNKVIGKTCNGRRPTWHITMRDRELTSTFNHPVLALKRETRRKRRTLEWEWREAQDVQVGDHVLVFTRAYERLVGESDGDLFDQMASYSTHRTVPDWIWSASTEAQRAFLHGYLVADGSLAVQQRGQHALAINAASEQLVREIRVLAQYVGYRTTKIRSHVTQTPAGDSRTMWRCYIYVSNADFRQIPSDCTTHDLTLDSHFAVRTVLSSEATGETDVTWDITVGEAHNFVAEGVVVHNTAMHRPNWTDQERQEKIQQYGGNRDDPDYRRNVLGLHGDATNALFVLHRLMRCVDVDESSDYNLEEYHHQTITTEQLEDAVSKGHASGLVDLLTFPERHVRYPVVWGGMDVGFTADPSEILMFAEYLPETAELKTDKAANRAVPENGLSRIKLIARFTLKRISSPEQMRAIFKIFDFYQPRGYAMDKTGNGLPLYQACLEALEDAEARGEMAAAEARRLRSVAERFKGYNFSEKVIVDIDDAIELDPHHPDPEKEAGINQNVLEYSTDALRKIVDQGRLLLPFDGPLIKEYQGQTFEYSKAPIDSYGRRRRVFSEGRFHALDASRMAVMGLVQAPIEEFLKKPKQGAPVLDSFVSV